LPSPAQSVFISADRQGLTFATRLGVRPRPDVTDTREDRELSHERLLLGIAREARFRRGPIEVVAVEDGIRERIENDRGIVLRRRWRV
jgi:hypothetical protein